MKLAKTRGAFLSTALVAVALLLTAPFEAAAVAFKKNSSTLKFNARQHQAGTVYRGQKVHGDFQFINVGRNPVKILGIHTPCGCTLDQSAVSRSYSPGQRGTLRVSFDTSHFAGSFHKKILLSVVAEQKQILVPLLISAHVVEEISLNPPIIAFTPQDVARQTIQQVKVNFKKLKDRKLTFDYDKRYFRIYPGKDPGKNSESFGVQVVGRSAAGWRQETVLVGNSSRHLPKLPLMVVYQVDTGIKVGPEYLEFGPIGYQKSRDKNIKVTGPSKSRLDKASVTIAIDQTPVADPSKWASAKILPGGKVVVTITNNLDRNGSLTGKVTLWAAKNPDIRYIIPLYGYLMR